MQITLVEPTFTRYTYVNPKTNSLHLLVPFVGGETISTDNTCESDAELTTFFENGAINELNKYKCILELHIFLLEENNPIYRLKKERLNQINLYLDTLKSMKNNYKFIINNFLKKPSNLYSIQLRPKEQDYYSKPIKPVFTVNRRNDKFGNPMSHLYKEMQYVFSKVILGQTNPQQKLIHEVLSSLTAEELVFAVADQTALENLQNLLVIAYKKQLPIEIAKTVQDDFFKSTVDKQLGNQKVDKIYIDGIMGFTGNETPKEYLTALLLCCVPNIEIIQQSSPFYQVADNDDKTETLSIMTQFYLGILNVYCRAKRISNKNFGKILDNNFELSHDLITGIAEKLTDGVDVESCIIAFFNEHAGKHEFDLFEHPNFNGSTEKSNPSKILTAKDQAEIQQKFEVTWRTVTATKENPHMDDFMFLDNEAQGKNAPFLSTKGLICTDFANIALANKATNTYFANIRREAAADPNLFRQQYAPKTIAVIEPEKFLDKLDKMRDSSFFEESFDICLAEQYFKILQLTYDVSKGQQDDAKALLEAVKDKHYLLTTAAKFTDYSGRTFNCTAYEYAYWAKDKYMCRMLELYMDDDTKELLLEKINRMETSGLEYQQNGINYKNPHYDMSFILKNLTISELQQLQEIIGTSIPKLNEATANNYKTIAFTADEYEELKKELESHNQSCITSFFYTSAPITISKKLQFDFKSLITALDKHIMRFKRLNYHEREASWIQVGQAQRDVPVHIAYEYCTPDRNFDPLPSFSEESIPRAITFHNYNTSLDELWFPLSSSSSGLGFDFAIERGTAAPRGSRGRWNTSLIKARLDLAAIRHLDTVRINDLEDSRANLSQRENLLEIKR